MKMNRNSVAFANEEDFPQQSERSRVMQQIFIEIYNYRFAWATCSEGERTNFAKKVVEAIKGLKSAGVDVGPASS